MKLIKKNLSTFIWVCLLGIIAGTLTWELIERILSQAGIFVNLSTDPVGFDLSVLTVYLKINPGSIAGAVGGVFLFRYI
jgi:hypothetical protein